MILFNVVIVSFGGSVCDWVINASRMDVSQHRERFTGMYFILRVTCIGLSLISFALGFTRSWYSLRHGSFNTFGISLFKITFGYSWFDNTSRCLL